MVVIRLPWLFELQINFSAGIRRVKVAHRLVQNLSPIQWPPCAIVPEAKDSDRPRNRQTKAATPLHRGASQRVACLELDTTKPEMGSGESKQPSRLSPVQARACESRLFA